MSTSSLICRMLHLREKANKSPNLDCYLMCVIVFVRDTVGGMRLLGLKTEFKL